MVEMECLLLCCGLSYFCVVGMLDNDFNYGHLACYLLLNSVVMKKLSFYPIYNVTEQICTDMLLALSHSLTH